VENALPGATPDAKSAERIYYFASSRHEYAFAIFAAFFAEELASSIRIIPYGALLSMRSFGPGVFIFTDFDRMAPRQLHVIEQLHDALRNAGCRVLNDPRRSLGRFDLLRRLHEASFNDFNVYRMREWRQVRRFPVFVRRESTHGRMLSDLIHDTATLERAVRHFENGPADLMIVEFGNSPGTDGKYRKYAAFRVGGTYYPQHVYSNEDWRVRFDVSARTDSWRKEHDEYLRTNPHRDQLERIFDFAHIDYGRIDYCVVNGRVQTFEINTNPTIIHASSKNIFDVSPYARAHRDAMSALLAEVSGPEQVDSPVFSPRAEPLDPDSLNDRVLARTRDYWRPYVEAVGTQPDGPPDY
jgi:hypothetical protein